MPPSFDSPSSSTLDTRTTVTETDTLCPQTLHIKHTQLNVSQSRSMIKPHSQTTTTTYHNLCQFSFWNLNTAPHPHSPLPRLCAAGRDLCQLPHQARSRLLIRYTVRVCAYVCVCQCVRASVCVSLRLFGWVRCPNNVSQQLRKLLIANRRESS